MGVMERPSPLPVRGDVFLDARGGDRSLRATWHPEAGVLVLSLWRGRTCVATFRMPAEDVPELVDVLRSSLREAYAGARGSLLGGADLVDDEHVG
jgi:hypothetical protein